MTGSGGGGGGGGERVLPDLCIYIYMSLTARLYLFDDGTSDVEVGKLVPTRRPAYAHKLLPKHRLGLPRFHFDRSVMTIFTFTLRLDWTGLRKDMVDGWYRQS